MKFSVVTALTTLLASGAMAAPADVDARGVATVSMTAAAVWTIEGMKRSCDKPDNKCAWSFTINNNAGSKQGCSYTVKRQGSHTPASRSPQTGVDCGVYTVTSGWSGQFGEGNGFTTLSVVNNKDRTIAWPAYTDKQLKGGKVVSPNQSYPVQNLP
ncbi:uncharacterized protein J7T54_007983 [Emericellopsis cladophorae]|uniref:Small secreted protein n=1 Tax=Emericellopsis cladophorae TaxID=2686198 RepID=A0A9P9Y8T0_9HYPO|nr:uncharacterized protein J7T54_007983 [Emericellopsis cladophorae]KAI6784889.1 hypothetical protein J7T54_007983 [Emericellopsis cladophorae]